MIFVGDSALKIYIPLFNAFKSVMEKIEAEDKL